MATPDGADDPPSPDDTGDPGDDFPDTDDEPRFNESLPQIQDDILDHPTRKQIAETVQEHPGSNLTQIANHVGIRRTALKEHLEILERWRILYVYEGVIGGNKHLFHAEDKHLWKPRRTRVLFSSKIKRQIARYIVNHAPSITREIADLLNQNPSTTRRHIRELRDDHQLIASIPKGRHHFHHPCDLLIEWEQSLGEHCEEHDP